MQVHFDVLLVQPNQIFEQKFPSDKSITLRYRRNINEKMLFKCLNLPVSDLCEDNTIDLHEFLSRICKGETIGDIVISLMNN